MATREWRALSPCPRIACYDALAVLARDGGGSPPAPSWIRRLEIDCDERGHLVPAIWLPTPELRAERERARWRLHLVKHRAILKNRVHASLIAFGHQVPMADLFGVAGRRLLDELDFPEPWLGHVRASLELIDELERRIGEIERWLRRSGADHRYIPVLMSAPGNGWITGFTIAAESATSTGSPRP
jgi:hypothetical protein